MNKRMSWIIAAGTCVAMCRAAENKAAEPVVQPSVPTAGLVLWLDAGDAGTLAMDGKEVLEWRDKSGNNRLVAQAEQSARPRLRKIRQSGPSALSFDGKSQFLAGSAVLPEGQKAYTIVALWRSRRNKGVQSVFEQATSMVGGARGALLLDNDTYGFCGEGNDCLKLVPFVQDAWRVTSMSVDPARKSSVRVRDNAAVYEGTAGNPRALKLGIGGVSVGRKLAVEREYFCGDIAELLVYNRVLNPDEELALQKGLVSKWGIDSSATQGELKGKEPPAQRDIALKQRYLHLPVMNGASERRMRFWVDGKMIREFMIELADGDPDVYVASGLSAFIGKQVSVEIDHAPSTNVLDGIVQAGDIPGAKALYQEKYRPQFHFSPRCGWVGDPNGLVFYKGEYHLFFQYNPYAVKWGNMSWGHAVSKDLVHWKELPITLFPPKLGDHPYSGSAVVDRENTAGFKMGAEDPIVIIFPSTKRGICLAYSTDAGRTFTEYSGNPLARNLGGDPRVFWHAQTRRWIMITCKVLKPSKESPPGSPGWLEKTLCGFEFYSSANLKEWKHHSTIEDCWECPDLFELRVDGKPGVTKWVLMPNHTPSLSGGGKYPGGRYLIGAFDGQRFTPEGDRLQFNFGNAYGAAQSYNGIPSADGRRINVGCAFGTRMPGMPFGQMMNFPTELSLQTTEDGLRLFAWPAKEVESLYADTRRFDDVALSPEGTVLPGVEGDMFDISAEFVIGADTEELGLKIRGVPVTFSAKARVLGCGDRSASLKPEGGKIKLRLLVDRVSIEIFANKGRVYMPMAILPKDENRSIAVFAKGGGVKLTTLTVNTLKSAWDSQ